MTLEGRTYLVTGASSGIGRETAISIARQGANLIITGRNPERTEIVRRELQAAGMGRVDAILADFSSLAEVRRLADEVLALDTPIHVLINNAGLWHNERKVSQDGFEETFAVNHLAPYLLTRLLLGRMQESEGDRRIIHVSSRLHTQAGKISGPIARAIHAANVLGIPVNARQATLDMHDLQSSRNYKGLEAYALSKLAQVVFSNELARRLGDKGPTTNSVHPGSVATNVTRDSSLLSLGTKIAAPFLKSPEEGAQTTLYAAIDPSLEGVTGKYLSDSAIAEPATISKDAAVGYQLWKVSAEMVGLEA